METSILIKEKQVLIDNEFLEMISKYSWHIRQGINTFYVDTSICGSTVPMHRLIMSIITDTPLEKLKMIDHINRNGLDNRVINLRIVSNSENVQNSTPRMNCSSKYTGVSLIGTNKFISYISKDNQKINLGIFVSDDQAASQYDMAAIKLFGNQAKLNFSEKRKEYINRINNGFDPIPKHNVLIPYSEHSGVTFRKDLDKWQAYISITQQKDNNLDGEHRIVVGTYNTEQEAIEAHKNAIDQLLLGNEIITPHQAKVKAPYNGVQLNKSGKYIARIVHNKERHSLDTYDTPEEAAEVYDCALIILHGDLSKLNFPTKIDEYKTKISNGYNPIQEKKAKTSKYKGISYRKDKKKWEAYIQDPETKKRKRLGYFTTENDAIEAVNESKQK